MSTHKPATPLPWLYSAAEYTGGNAAISASDAGSGFHTSEGWHYVVPQVVGSNRTFAADNAAYIAHAANAYPRLIEALRKIAAEKSTPQGTSRDALRRCNERATALLREMGEEGGAS